MIKDQDNSNQNKCDKTSCACKEENKDSKENSLTPNSNAEPKDPTRFGDWEVKGRAIDF